MQGCDIAYFRVRMRRAFLNVDTIDAYAWLIQIFAQIKW